MGAVQVASRMPAAPDDVVRRTPQMRRPSPRQAATDRELFLGIVVSLRGDPTTFPGGDRTHSVGSPAVRLEA